MSKATVIGVFPQAHYPRLEPHAFFFVGIWQQPVGVRESITWLQTQHKKPLPACNLCDLFIQAYISYHTYTFIIVSTAVNSFFITLGLQWSHYSVINTNTILKTHRDICVGVITLIDIAVVCGCKLAVICLLAVCQLLQWRLEGRGCQFIWKKPQKGRFCASFLKETHFTFNSQHFVIIITDGAT